MPHLTITEASASLAALIDRARAGEPVVITEGGHLVAELRAVTGESGGGSAAGSIEWLASRRIRVNDTEGKSALDVFLEMRDEYR